MLVAMFAWGSWANTQKLAPKVPFTLFYWDYVIGVLGATLLFGIGIGGGFGGHGPSFGQSLHQASLSSVLFALAGGVVFNLANLLLVAAIAVAGLAVAFPMGIGLALAVGVCLNYAITPRGDPRLLFGGVALVLAAIALDALAYSRRGDAERRDIGLGIRLSLLCGVLMGSFYPLVARAEVGPQGLNAYAVAFVFAIGVLLCALPVNSLLMRRPIAGESPTTFKAYRSATLATHACGLLGGLIWGVGLMLSLLAGAAAMVGPAVSYALGQGATMISAGWGVFVWKEFADAPAASRNLLLPMFVLFLAGLAMVAVAPLPGV